MRIAIFTETFEPQLNGVTVYLKTLSLELEKRGHEVFILAPRIKGFKDSASNVIRIPSIKIISSEPEALLPVVFPSNAYKKMLEIKVDLVHAHGNGAFSLLGYQVARIKGIPFILTFHNDHTKYTHYIFGGKIITPKMVAYALKFFANISDGVTTPSLKMKRELRRYGVTKEIEVIPNFLDDSPFRIAKGNFLHDFLQLPPKSLIVLSVGRLTKEKSFEFLIKSFKLVLKQNRDAHLVIVGKGPERENLISLVGRLGISDSVHFTGQISMEEIPKVYASANLFATASLSEVHPVSALEAAFSGLPLVAVSDDAFSGIVENNVNGFITNHSEKDFASKILELLQDRTLAKKFGNESRKIAGCKFRVENVIGKQIAYYEKVVEQYKQKKPVILVERVEIFDIDSKKFWRMIKDIPNYPRFIKFNLKSELLSKFGPGGSWSDWSTICWIPWKIYHEILKVVPGKRVVYLIRFAGGGLIFQDIKIKKVASRTEIKINVKITFGSRLSAFLLRSILQNRTIAMADGSLENIRKLVLQGELEKG